MSSRTRTLPRHREDVRHPRIKQGAPDSDSAASFAALTMSRQRPGLILPSLEGIPTSCTHGRSAGAALPLARSLVNLGLGSESIWHASKGDIASFIRACLQDWLDTVGAAAIRKHVRFDLGITDTADPFSIVVPPEGKCVISLELTDECGLCMLGEPVRQLEEVQQGLGKAFFLVLMDTLTSWMPLYDSYDAAMYIDRWRENVEEDMAHTSDCPEEQTLEEYCDANDIFIPDLTKVIPACVLDKARSGVISANGAASDPRLLSLLQQHRHGRFEAWINPVLQMAAIPTSRPDRSRAMDDMLDGFDAGPLPAWVVAFDANDAILQAFDDESEYMHEATHAPFWLEIFDPANISEVHKVLTHVQHVLAVNRHLVGLATAIEKGRFHERVREPGLDDTVCAA